MATRIEIPLENEQGATIGALRISELPHLGGSLISGDDRSRDQMESACLLEAKEYRYQWLLERQSSAVATDRLELFIPDDITGLTGRLRTGLFVGTLPVRLSNGGESVGACELEIASAKLNYLSDYRWMLRDIAAIGSMLVSAPFAATEQRYSSDTTKESSNAYTELRFILNLLSSHEFQGAIRRVIERPYLSWVESEEQANISMGLRAGASGLRPFLRPGVRVAAPGLALPFREFGVPRTISATRSRETSDNPPNRFVKQTLQNWLARCYQWSERLPRLGHGSKRRGDAELTAAISFLEETLQHDVLASVNTGRRASLYSTVVQRRAGYREILSAALTVDAASELAWGGAADVFSAGQKNVAVLFEYWCYLQLVDCLVRAFDVPQHQVLAISRTHGSSFNLSRSTDARVTIEASVNGRRIAVDAYFNLSFGRNGSDASSWTQVFRPDVSVQFRPLDADATNSDGIWIHFDAKYRVDRATEVLGEEQVSGSSTPLGGSSGKSLPDDLAKMHTYRDAIRRSAGAFVLYPGTVEQTMPQYSEVLPGLGAFPLRPTSDGGAEGTSSIEKFFKDTAVHFASQFSRHYRGRFWEHESYQGAAHVVQGVTWTPFLRRPPSDTRVLLGFVRDGAHLDWIRRTQRYNLRADERSGTVGDRNVRLDYDLILLYCPNRREVSLWEQNGAVELRTREQMEALGYPRAKRGSSYLCIPLGDELSSQWPALPSVKEVLHVLRARFSTLPWGAPAVLRFDELESLRINTPSPT